MNQRKPPLHLDELTLQRHDEACRRSEPTYIDPHTGYQVITQRAHEERGKCCGSRCRHCPFDWINVPTTLLPVVVFLMVLSCMTIGMTAQWRQRPMDTVAQFVPGTGQRLGQGPAFFPRNVLTGPSIDARDSVAATDPREICSIGLGGTITIGLRSGMIVDGEGPDFTVFENAFRYGAGRIYVEPATVEVSRDGIDWVLFPYDTTLWTGLAGTTPTSGRNPYDPLVSGGDSFDLRAVGADSIRWVRLTDVTAWILANPRGRYYDPTLTGFDLDVVLVRNGVDHAWDVSITPNVVSTSVELALPRRSIVQVMDVTGRTLQTASVDAGISTMDISWLPLGWYYVIIHDGDQILLRKVLRS